MNDVPRRPSVLRKVSAAKTRAHVLEAAAAEFAEKGLDGARVASIAERAGVAVSSIYHHFADKDALFDAVIRAAGEFFVSDLQSGVGSADTPRARDLAAITRAVSFAEARPAMFRILMNPGRTQRGARTALAQMIEEVRRAQYPEGKASGLFHPNLHETLTAVFETGVVFVVLDWWLDHPHKATRAQVIETLVNVRRFGVEIPAPGGPDFVTPDDLAAL